MRARVCKGCGQQVKGEARLVGGSRYTTCEYCGCHIHLGEGHTCSICGIRIIRDPGFAGENCAVCEDYGSIIKERIQDVARDFNLTLDQVYNIVKHIVNK